MPYVFWTHMVNHVLLNFIPPFNMALHSLVCFKQRKIFRKLSKQIWLCEIWCPCVQLPFEENGKYIFMCPFLVALLVVDKSKDKSTFIILYIFAWCTSKCIMKIRGMVDLEWKGKNVITSCYHLLIGGRKHPLNLLMHFIAYHLLLSQTWRSKSETKFLYLKINIDTKA